MSILRIKELAQKKGVSFSKIAYTLNVTPQTITNWLKGETSPRVDDLQKIASALDCELPELFKAGDNYIHIYDESGNWHGIKNNF